MSDQVQKIQHTGDTLPGLMRNELNSFFRFFNFTKQTFFTGQKLYERNSNPGHIFYVNDGLVNLLIKDINKKEIIVSCASAGSFLGINNIMYNERYEHTAIAAKDSEIIMIQKNDFQKILHTNPEASKRFIVFLCKLLYAADKNIYNKNLKHMKRVAEAIVILFTNPELKKRGSDLNVTFDDIHHLTGIPVPVVENTLNEFSTRQLINTFRKKIKNADITGLKKIMNNN